MAAKTTDNYLGRELLRFAAVGSVDDGKSTLIGRLLYDSGSVYEEQLEAISSPGETPGDDQINLSLLTDSLRAEREQGITIDVAYRYFLTAKRKFIIADTPGHIQYTRNMITGASNADFVLILIDARKGVVEQTHRHTYISSLLGIKHLVVCVNKMDLVDYREDIFELIKSNFNNFLFKLDYTDVLFIPVCALYGDNVVRRSGKMPWYKGLTLLNLLETIPLSGDENLNDQRFPVQHVVQDTETGHTSNMGCAGTVAGGIFKPGDHVVILPAQLHTTIMSIDSFDGPVEQAFPPMSVRIIFTDDVEICRGDMIAGEDNLPFISRDFDVMLCWLNSKKLLPDNKYIIKHTTCETQCYVKEIRYKVDVNTLSPIAGITEAGQNDIARVALSATQPLVFDKFQNNRITGSIILIDELTNETVGAGMII
ncbi:MAG TPA: GTP-binding protein [Bacteroidales bacterium]|nr:GTP-binding protein [Bacteroidales bacterium]